MLSDYPPASTSHNERLKRQSKKLWHVVHRMIGPFSDPNSTLAAVNIDVALRFFFYWIP